MVRVFCQSLEAMVTDINNNILGCMRLKVDHGINLTYTFVMGLFEQSGTMH